MREKNEMDKKQDFIVMYHGAVVPGRDVERIIELVSKNQNIRAVILGNSTREYGMKLRASAEKYGVLDRVLFHKAVPLTELWKYVGAADVGLILARATCKNHLFSLPNKFFENIQAGTPVICPNYPAFRSVVDKFGNGLLCDPDSMESINDCVEKLRMDERLYRELKTNTIIAKEELNWATEKQKLGISYEKIFACGG